MKDLRSRMSYANVVATLALFLALTGGTVYAASKLGRDEVKSKNIAKGAVKNSDLAKNSVKGKNIKGGAVASSDLTADLLSKLDTEVTASASGGPAPIVAGGADVPLPITGTTTFTSKPGEVTAIAAEGLFTVATSNVANECSPDVRVYVDGEPTNIFVSPEGDVNSATLKSSTGRDAYGPYGLVDPGVQHTLTASLSGDPDCLATSTLDKLEIRVVQIR